jgi:2-hydroxyacyl-CoA lyase 1
MSSPIGAVLIARALHELGVKVIFGLVGVPVVQIAEEVIALGIRFIAFRNEQAASYAATAYGYLTGRPGVCLVVGGPGVLHAMAGVGNSSANAFPLLLLVRCSLFQRWGLELQLLAWWRIYIEGRGFGSTNFFWRFREHQCLT